MDFFSDHLRTIILGSLGFTVLLCVSLYFFKPAEGVLVYDPVGDKLIRYFAYGFGVFAVIGIVCIFVKSIRIPIGIAFGMYVLMFLCVCVLLKMHESVAFKKHKNDIREARYCTVTKHRLEGDRNYYLNLQFDGEENEWEFLDNNGHLLFFDNVELGDRACARCVKGSFGITYIFSLKRVNFDEPTDTQ